MAKKNRPKNQRPAKTTTSELSYSTARSFIQFVVVGHNYQPFGTAYEMSFHLPKRMLLVFALNLFLKARIHHSETTKSDLRDIYGHDIEYLYQAAIANDLSQMPGFDRLVQKLQFQP